MVRRTKRITLEVPAGVDSGSRLRVRSEGKAGKRGESPSDLFIMIDMIPDPVLKRDNNTILRTTIKVPTVDGMVDQKIPAGTQRNATLVMAKKGVRYLNESNRRGDQLVRVQVEIEIPKWPHDEDRKLVEQLEVLSKGKVTASLR